MRGKTMNNDYLDILIGLTAGFCLGIIFFGGLWIVIGRLIRARNSIFLLILSYFGRIAVCLLGFFLILTFTGPKGLIAGLAGFIITQLLLVRRLGKKEGKR
jgi:F1F0 ATPase subunit 2